MPKQNRTSQSSAIVENTKTSDAQPPDPRTKKKMAHSVRFWGIFVALCILAFESALDVSIIATALPRIIAEIGGGNSNLYIWVANCFVIASTIVQSLFGQLANLFGRRAPFIASVVLFAVGSGVGGGASNIGMLIAGRTIQGLGAGGIYVLLNVVCCDLVPQHERGKYLELMFSWSGVAAGLGPVVGGALAESQWRWIFYMNLPICGLALLMLIIFLRAGTGAASIDPNVSRSRQIDYLGNAIFFPSMVAFIYGLVAGGNQHPWTSWRTILPLVLGCLGWAGFHVQQSFSTYPSVPNRLFGNRTSAITFGLTFLSSILLQMVCYFIPVYFQARGYTILDSGVNFLPFAMGSLASAVVAGILLSKFGKYKPLHGLAFALSALSFGLFTLLDGETPTAQWAIFQLIASAGAGFILSVLLPAITATLPESDVASAAATFGFIQTFGDVWGVTIASLMFNASFNDNLERISSMAWRAQLKDGAAYSFASEGHRLRDDPAWDSVVDVYSRSLRVVWWAGLGISLVSMLIVLGENEYELKQELDTEYGINDTKGSLDPEKRAP